jgi:glycosyltransferase involved in cell wall biosynthesis
MLMMQIPTYFYPEQMSSSYQYNDLLVAFAEHGIENIIYAPTPTRGINAKTKEIYAKAFYEEMHNGMVKVWRFSAPSEQTSVLQRAYRYLLINLKQYLWGKKQKGANVIFGISTPPTQGLVCAMIKHSFQRKGKYVPFVYRIHDVFPDSMVNANMTHQGSMLWRIGRWIENMTYKAADKIIVVSESIKENLLNKGVPAEKLEVIPDWIDLDNIHPIDRAENHLIDELSINRDDFLVVYAGNMGAAQGTDIIVEAAQKLRNLDRVKFVIFGGGVEYSSVMEKAERMKLTNVVFHKLMPQERLSEVYCMGNIAIITCKPGTGMAGMPSKTWYSMACGTPIVAAFDLESELASIIRSTNAGVVVPAGDVESFTEAIKKAFEDWDINTLNSSDAREYVLNTRNKKACTKKIVDLFKEFEEQEKEYAK